jgi:antimicrobial peptide system SdpB family protein
MITGFFHWWVCFSLNTTSLVIDGGDQVAAVLSLLMLPICLTDRRRFHWEENRNSDSENYSRELSCFISFTSYVVIRYQVALIYFESVISKFKVPEWIDGTATYYWFLNPYMGVSESFQNVFLYFLSNPYIVCFTTWGALFLEFFLFAGLFLDKKYRPILFLIGIFFHAMIAIFFGLIPFFFSMAACLTIYLVPINISITSNIYLFKEKTWEVFHF